MPGTHCFEEAIKLIKCPTLLGADSASVMTDKAELDVNKASSEDGMESLHDHSTTVIGVLFNFDEILGTVDDTGGDAYEPHIPDGVIKSVEKSCIREGGKSAAYAIETLTKRLAVLSEPIPSVEVPPIE